MKLAFGSVPKDSGTFTFYRNIRPALLRQGIEMFCVSVGRPQALLWEEKFADEGCVLLAASTYSVKKQARAFVSWCQEEGIDVVMGINSEAILSAIPHLPPSVRVVSRCANAFDHGYRITLSGGDRLQAIFALTPRLKDDLIESYHADPHLIHLIPNGIDPVPFEQAKMSKRGNEEILRLAFLGRLEHNQKGVMHLPEIVKAIAERNIPFHLRIAGKGKDGDKLAKALNPYVKDGSVELIGSLDPTEVPAFLGSTDIYLFPSHFEGCPNALLEAMMAGCLCMAWKIDGITDFVLENGRTGFIFKTGAYDEMADTVLRLHHDRSLLRSISEKAAEEARIRFTPDITAAAYAKVLKQVKQQDPYSGGVKPWSRFRIEPNFKQKGDPILPRRWKAWIKSLLSKPGWKK
jgi:glycosyltransferase involved in cell wall biosynthesis